MTHSPRLMARQDQDNQEVYLPNDTPVHSTGRRFTRSQSGVPVASSSAGIIHVVSYTPKEGEGGVPITVRINFDHPSLSMVYIRLIIGHRAVATTVRELNDTIHGRWQLDASAPTLDHLPASSKVLITVQALSMEDEILDSVTFGEFSYWISGCRFSTTGGNDDLQRVTRRTSASSSSHNRSHLSLQSSDNCSPRRSCLRPSIVTRSRPHIHGGDTHRRTRSPQIVRGKPAEEDEGHIGVRRKPILQLVTPLEDMCHGWEDAEIASGRRLVLFQKLQDGRKLIVSCEPIKQDDYCETDIVISCIYRAESDVCFVTSVDIIYLLERLTNSEFQVEEKNRIRRNLEGLRPITVSKHKRGFEDFFQCIMEFPEPRPRNIEKDLKVFEWSTLAQALAKILSKYTILDAQSLGNATPHSAVPTLVPSPEPQMMSTHEADSNAEGIDPHHVMKCEPSTEDVFLPYLIESAEASTSANDARILDQLPGPVYTPPGTYPYNSGGWFQESVDWDMDNNLSVGLNTYTAEGYCDYYDPQTEAFELSPSQAEESLPDTKLAFM